MMTDGPEQSNVEFALQQLERAITSGYLPCDSPLPSERVLAREFRVSRASLREAKLRLMERGCILRRGRHLYPVRAEGRHGPVPLAKDRAKRFRQALAVRRMVWAELARLAAKRRTPDKDGAIAKAAMDYELTCRLSRIPEELATAASRFGAALAHAARNAVLANCQAYVMRVLQDAHELWLMLRHPPRSTLHQELARAVAEGRTADAVRIAKREFRKFDEWWLETSFRVR